MRVYVVLYNNYEATHVEGVYETIEQAMAKRAEQRWPDEYGIDIWDVGGDQVGWVQDGVERYYGAPVERPPQPPLVAMGCGHTATEQIVFDNADYVRRRCLICGRLETVYPDTEG